MALRWHLLHYETLRAQPPRKTRGRLVHRGGSLGLQREGVVDVGILANHGILHDFTRKSCNNI